MPSRKPSRPRSQKSQADHHRGNTRTQPGSSARNKTKQAKTRRTGHQNRSSSRDDGDESFYLYGIHAVEAALNNPSRSCHDLKLTPNAEQRLKSALRAHSATYEQVTPKELDQLLGKDCVHQGAALKTEALREPDLADLAGNAANGRPLIVLDQITDPHNLGAILRSCAVFGAAGIVTTRRNSPPLTGTVAKTASGGLEYVPVALVPNLARAMGSLKDLGFQIIGLDGEGETLLHDADTGGLTAIVLGAEGTGLRRLTRDNCDMICRISTSGPLSSLNVSNAAAVCLHLASMRRATAD